MIAKKQHPKQFGGLFDTISVCFSKGMGCPIGSVLLSDAETMRKALRIRKIFGGNLRQSGYLAAAGIYALQNNINRLEDDHNRAKELGNTLQKLSWVASVQPVETNIVVFSVIDTIEDKMVIEKLKQKGVAISLLAKNTLRMVTHLDYKQVMHEYVIDVLGKIEL